MEQARLSDATYAVEQIRDLLRPFMLPVRSLILNTILAEHEDALAGRVKASVCTGDAPAVGAAPIEGQDPLAGFFRDRCCLGPGYQVPANQLQRAYVEWCQVVGERYPLGLDQFTSRLQSRGSGIAVIASPSGYAHCFGIGLKGPQ